MPVMPRPKAVKDLLEGMLDREVEVTAANPPRAADLAHTALALYVDTNMHLVAVAGVDLVLAVTVGAAIGLVPPGGAKACVADRALSPKIAANFSDACETIGVLLDRDGEPPVRLHQLFLPGNAAPGDANSRLLALGRRLDLDVTVPGYGTGRLSLSA
jgi:hypothetical protein